MPAALWRPGGVAAEGHLRSEGWEGARAWSMFGGWRYHGCDTGGSEAGEAAACGRPQVEAAQCSQGGMGAWAEGSGPGRGAREL